MTVSLSSSTPPPVFKSREAASQPATRNTAETGSGFADLLRGAGPSGERRAETMVGEATGLPVPASTASMGADPLGYAPQGAKHFEVRSEIGDSAVRFDARPIVAPTGAPGAGDFAIGVSAGAEVQTPEIPGLDAKQLAALVEALTQGVASLIGDPNPSRFAESNTAGPRGETRVPRAGLTAETRAAAAQSAIRAGLSRADTTARIAAGSGVKAPASSTNNSALFARIAALPREIAVVIRGVNLSAQDREIIGERLASLFAEHGLADRTIRIISTTRRA